MATIVQIDLSDRSESFSRVDAVVLEKSGGSAFVLVLEGN